MWPALATARLGTQRGESASAPVRYDTTEGQWYVEVSCADCGGYRIRLDLADPAQQERAASRGRYFINEVHLKGCLGCEAHRWRTCPPSSDGAARLWWDTETSQWMASLGVCGSQAVSLPLGVRRFWAQEELRGAAMALLRTDRLALRVAQGATALRRDSSTLYRDGGQWRLWVACFGCGGFKLGLESGDGRSVEAACDEALRCLDLVARESCPGCRTRRERGTQRDSDDEPRIWYDVECGDWLVWQGFEECPGGVALPLGIHWFGARRATVYRAAAAILFDSQLFLDEGI